MKKEVICLLRNSIGRYWGITNYSSQTSFLLYLFLSGAYCNHCCQTEQQLTSQFRKQKTSLDCSSCWNTHKDLQEEQLIVNSFEYSPILFKALI